MKLRTLSAGRVLLAVLIAALALAGGCKATKLARENQAPRITSVEIQPQTPGAGQDLNALVQYRDLEGDAVVLEYRWTINGQVKQEGSGLSNLPGSLVTLGAKIGLEVQARDAGHSGEWVAATPVQAGEAEVKLKGVSLEPEQAYWNTTLEAKVDAGDASAESPTLHYRWLVNGQVVENASDPTLADAFAHGDYVIVEVSANSEFPQGKTLRSTPLLIRNTQPEITSALNFAWDGEKFTYQMQATDRDGDNLTYFLEKGPPGMTGDSKTGLFTWKPAPNAAGTYEVRVGVDDGKGGKVGQAGELNVSEAKPPTP